MMTLIIADHNNAELKVSTRNVLQAATTLGEVQILVAGDGCAAVAEQAASLNGVSKVLLAEHPAYAHQLAENLAPLIVEVGASHSHILFSAGTEGKNVAPRVAALLGAPQLSDIIAVESEDTFQRPFYAGNLIATVRVLNAVKVLTVRTTAFDPVADGSSPAPVEVLSASVAADSALSSFVSEQQTESERPELSSASVVISGGRGMGTGESFALLEAVADKLGAAVGASRAAVDAGFVPNDMQVGQTGKIVAPQLDIAVGISGAIQHLAGMKDSKVIVAINKDEEAPIFQVADYGLVADLFEAVPELERAL